MYLDLCQTCILFYLIAEGSNIWGRDRGEEEGQRNCLNFLRVVWVCVFVCIGGGGRRAFLSYSLMMIKCASG